MAVWRLVAHDESPKPALRWATTAGRLAIGWGKIGDLRLGDHTSHETIRDAICSAYPGHHPSNAVSGGRSLWSLWQEMKERDLVIISADGRRGAVMRVAGPYLFASEDEAPLGGDYQHQRMAERLDVDPDELWHRAGGRGEGSSIYWALIRCQRDVSERALGL